MDSHVYFSEEDTESDSSSDPDNIDVFHKNIDASNFASERYRKLMQESTMTHMIITEKEKEFVGIVVFC